VHPIEIAGRTNVRMQHIYGYIGALAAMGACASGGAGQYYQGYAYAEDDGRPLYQEGHWLYPDGGVEHRLVVYSCPDGRPFVRKRVDATPGTATPDVDLFDGRGGYREGVRTRDGRREVFAQADAASAERSAQLPQPTPPNAVIDAGFDAFIREHWDTLSGSGVSPVLFLVPSELRYLDFSARVLRDSRTDGAGLRWFRLSLANWYGFALPHIDVAYDVHTHELREFRGLSNIRDGSGHNVRVDIRFPPAERRADVAAAEVERAAAMPLTGRCLLR
jgi:hypothetical protein